MKETRVYELSDRTVHDVCVKLQKPYFGPHLYARQGEPRRHLYMQAVVDSQAKLAGAQPLNILEVGSWAGGLAITWALALRAFHKPAGKVVCVDPWRPYLDLKALSPTPIYSVMSDAAASGEIYELFQHNLRSAAVDDIVMPFRGDSDSTLPLLADDAFDIVFIDGAHDYGSVAKDLRNTARLVREGGILCGDDLEAQYGCVDADFNRANLMNDFVEDPKTRTWYHPGSPEQ